MIARTRMPLGLISAPALLWMVLPHTVSASVTGPCTATSCGNRVPQAMPAAQLSERRAMLRAAPSRAATGNPGAGQLTLLGELAGDWDDVDGNVVFTYDASATAPAVGVIQVLVRGFSAVREPGTPRYRVHWDRAAYWLDFDGAGPSIPHLLGAVERTNSYVPASNGDPYPEFAADPAVQASCTTQEPCTVNISPFVLLREPGVDYSAYPDDAASADLLFVANAQGQAIAGVVDIYDENEEYVETKPLTEGDQLQLSTLGFKLSEPDFLYTVTYTDFVTLDDQLQIQLENHIPGAEFPDPDLPPNFNAGLLRMKLLLDAFRNTGGSPTYTLAGPFDLGFNWAAVQDFLFRSGYEALSAAPTQAPPRPLVSPAE